MNVQFMKRAIQLSAENIRNGNGGPFGAVIVKDGQILGEGGNQVTSTNDPTAHAEVVAIRKACQKIANFDLSGAEIYTSCEPCPMCLAAIYWARIDKIYYANDRADAAAIDFDDDFLYNEIPKALKDRLIPMTQCCHGEAREVFKEWQEKADKITY